MNVCNYKLLSCVFFCQLFLQCAESSATSHYAAIRGDRVSIKCEHLKAGISLQWVKHRANFDLTLARNGVTQHTGHDYVKYVVETDVGNSETLDIVSVSWSDAGKYSCSDFDDSNDFNSRYFQLIVINEVQTCEQYPRTLHIGDMRTCECTALYTGNTVPIISFYMAEDDTTIFPGVVNLSDGQHIRFRYSRNVTMPERNSTMISKMNFGAQAVLADFSKTMACGLTTTYVPARVLRFKPYNETYAIGTKLMLSVDASTPRPTYGWAPDGGTVSTTNELQVTHAMDGESYFNISANVTSPKDHTVWSLVERVHFRVGTKEIREPVIEHNSNFYVVAIVVGNLLFWGILAAILITVVLTHKRAKQKQARLKEEAEAQKQETKSQKSQKSQKRNAGSRRSTTRGAASAGGGGHKAATHHQPASGQHKTAIDHHQAAHKKLAANRNA